MYYSICHQSSYAYASPVLLDCHSLRLCPRSQGSQWLRQFRLTVRPEPLGQTYCLDAEGNTVVQLWFDSRIVETLQITSHCEVETTCPNPFDYLAESWVTQVLPWDYPQSLAAQLQAYLHPPGAPHDNPAVVMLAQEILASVDGDYSLFLTQLNQTIYQDYHYDTRPSGPPWPPGLTLSQRAGSCRDFSVLFMAACRAVGLAARFVSGYQAGDPDQAHRDLHAWAEVYVPGGGWRGFDPTLGLAVGDRHIALAASAFPLQTTPIAGQFRASQRESISLPTSDLTTHIQLTQTP